VRAYAANTHSGVFNEINNDILSIVTNLQANGKYNQHMQVSFFAMYDGHNGSACAEYLRDSLHVYLSKEEHFPENMIEALTNTLRKVEADFLRTA
jgi:protein phosphatase 2C family protein 2/3